MFDSFVLLCVEVCKWVVFVGGWVVGVGKVLGEFGWYGVGKFILVMVG